MSERGRAVLTARSQPEPRVEVTAETVWQIADGLRKRFAVSNGTQVWVEYQGSAESLADSIKEILDEADLTTQPAISVEQVRTEAERRWPDNTNSMSLNAERAWRQRAFIQGARFAAGLTVAGESQ